MIIDGELPTVETVGYCRSSRSGLGGRWAGGKDANGVWLRKATELVGFVGWESNVVFRTQLFEREGGGEEGGQKWSACVRLGPPFFRKIKNLVLAMKGTDGTKGTDGMRDTRCGKREARMADGGWQKGRIWCQKVKSSAFARIRPRPSAFCGGEIFLSGGGNVSGTLALTPTLSPRRGGTTSVFVSYGPSWRVPIAFIRHYSPFYGEVFFREEKDSRSVSTSFVQKGRRFDAKACRTCTRGGRAPQNGSASAFARLCSPFYGGSSFSLRGRRIANPRYGRLPACATRGVFGDHRSPLQAELQLNQCIIT